MHILIFIWSLLSLLLSLILLLSHQFYLVLLLLLTIIMIIINIIILFLSLFLKIIILITHSNRSCTCQFRWQRRRQRATRSSSIICVLEYSKIFNVVSLTQQLDVFFYIYTETFFFFFLLSRPGETKGALSLDISTFPSSNCVSSFLTFPFPSSSAIWPPNNNNSTLFILQVTNHSINQLICGGYKRAHCMLFPIVPYIRNLSK